VAICAPHRQVGNRRSTHRGLARIGESQQRIMLLFRNSF
jgi:hypothetical protein